jgi:ferric hydroxamate transport system permease protein
MSSLVETVSTRPVRGPAVIAVLMLITAVLETAACLAAHLPFARWCEVLRAHPVSLDVVVVRYALLPRVVVSVLSGAALGLSGLIFQNVLRNPVAEPTTLGVAAGANLALTVGSLWFPAWLAFGREWVALGGALIAVTIVLAIAWRRTLSPLTVILGGLVVTLCSGAFSSLLMLFFGDSLGSLFIWQSGMLDQNDWSTVTYLVPRLAAAFAIAALMIRPLAMLEMGDETARSLGLPVRTIRALAMVLASALAAVVVSGVGVIGFIGLAGPALARLAGARTLRSRIAWAPAIAACMLWISDQTVQLAGIVTTEIPTGTATALLGGPLLLWLLPRLKSVPATARDFASHAPVVTPRAAQIAAALLLFVVSIWMAADVARTASGWHVDDWDTLRPLLSLRLPRVGGALAAGAMLAIAGVLMQRMTGNPMASPEVLGISSGASLGLVVLLFVSASPGNLEQLVFAFTGALATLSLMFALGRCNGFSPERLVLAGVAVATVFSGLAALLVSAGDPRMALLQAWMSGSTYRVEPSDAFVALAVAALGCCALPLFTRTLDILPLGDATVRSLGVDIGLHRRWLLLLASVLTAASTLIVGPISFVGLMGPHLARLLGLRRAVAQACGGALIGATLLVIADWLGRNVLFPDQVPAGLFATFIGGPYFLFLMYWQRSGPRGS